MPRPKKVDLSCNVRIPAQRIPLSIRVDGVKRLVLHENGDLILNRKKVGNDPELAVELLKLGKAPVKKKTKSAGSGRKSTAGAAQGPTGP